MDMTLSKRGDYVMRSAISLARVYDENVSRKIREVVAETEVPQTFASQILADLVRAGLASSKAGRTGGYRLARPPSDISVLEVIEAAEGPLRAERCALSEGPCRWSSVCPLHETWSAATAALRELLAKTTLAEVAARDIAIEAGTYPVPADSHRSHPIAVDVADVVQVEVAAPDVRAALARLGPDLAQLVVDDSAPATGAQPPARSRRRSPVSVEISLVPHATGVDVANGTRRAQRQSSTGYQLSWRFPSPEPTSWLEADLWVAPVDAERSEVRVEGKWRRRFEAGAPLAADELDQRAHRAVRLFLRALARAIEEAPTAARRQPSTRQRRADRPA